MHNYRKRTNSQFLKEVKKSLGVNNEKIAHIFGVKTTTVDKWLYEGRAPETKFMYLAIFGFRAILKSRKAVGKIQYNNYIRKELPCGRPGPRTRAIIQQISRMDEGY